MCVLFVGIWLFRMLFICLVFSFFIYFVIIIVVMLLFIRLVSVWVLDIKWLILRISVRLVIGKCLMVEMVVVSMMKLLLVIFVVFFEESSSIISRVI